MEQSVDLVQCVVCGTSVPRAGIDVVSEGAACAPCAAERARQDARRVAPLAKTAAALALVPVAFGYRITSIKGGGVEGRSTEIRLLVMHFSEGSSAAVTMDGVAGGAPLVRTVFDPIAVGGGALAVLVGAIALAVLARSAPRSSRSLGVSAAALLVGAFFVLRGLGKV
jgi:hypothetical protein